MTTTQLRKSLKAAGKPVCLSHLYRLFRILDIQPLGRSRPQLYPPNTAQRILTHLGMDAASLPIQHLGTVEIPPWSKEFHAGKKLITVAQLRAAKPKTKGTK